MEIRSRDPTTPIRGHFVIRTQGGSVLYVCIKFQADSYFLSKVIMGSQNFEIGSCDPGHAHLGVVLCFVRIGSVLHLSTKFAADYSIRSKVIKGSQKFGN